MATTLSFPPFSTLIVETLKHIHIILVVIIPYFSHPLQTPTKILSTFYSTFQNPISSSSSFETTPIVKFLLNKIEFSSTMQTSFVGKKWICVVTNLIIIHDRPYSS
jgi:hypothetical protein